MTPVYLCVHVPEFPAQARLRHRPALRSQAVAILHGTPPLETVCSATRAARNAGVRRGNTRAELESLPGVQMLQRSQPEEDSAAAALLSAVWNVSPRAQVLGRHIAAHRLVLDMAGTGRMYGNLAAVARHIAHQVGQLGLVAHCAVSHNLHTAVCVAPFAGTVPRIVPQGQERAALAPLPLTALEALTPEQHDIFDLWGLRTLGELAALPETQLVARMGQAGKQIWLLARGEHGHLLQPEEERFTLEERTGFDAPVEMLDSLLFVMGPMLDQLVLRAGSHALALASVTVRLQLTNHAAEDTAAAPGDVAEYARTIKPALPLAESRVLLKLLHLELQAHPPGAPVLSIHLQAEPGGRARAQLGLFSPQLPEPSRLDVTLARIRAMVGEGRVGRPRLVDTLEPDSFTVEPFTAPATVKRSPRTPSNGQGVTAQSTLAFRRMRPPLRLRMHSSNASPTAFHLQGKRYNVTAAFGPWRHSGNWWSTAAWSREEWDLTATASDGSTLACRVARDLLHRHWQLDGFYD